MTTPSNDWRYWHIRAKRLLRAARRQQDPTKRAEMLNKAKAYTAIRDQILKEKECGGQT